jgi:hypothetical protein
MRTTNKTKILSHMNEHGTISPLEALVLHRIVRLAPRICELRQQGHAIATSYHADPAGVTYTRYSLA